MKEFYDGRELRTIEAEEQKRKDKEWKREIERIRREGEKNHREHEEKMAVLRKEREEARLRMPPSS